MQPFFTQIACTRQCARAMEAQAMIDRTQVDTRCVCSAPARMCLARGANQICVR